MSENQTEVIVSSEYVFRGFFLKVIRDIVRLPNGKQATREYIHHPGAALIIPLLDNGRLVMEKQYRHALKKVFLEFPAGKMDQGETPLQTAQRELLEETGYTAKEWKHLTTIHPVIGYANERIEIFLAQGLEQKGAQLDEGEHLDVVETEFTDLLKLVQAGEVTDVKTQIGVFWLEKIKMGLW